MLQDLDIGEEFEIVSTLDLDFEAYRSISVFNATLSDTQKRFIDLSVGSDTLEIKRLGNKYVVDVFMRGNYTLFLVSSSKNTVKIKKTHNVAKEPDKKLLSKEKMTVTNAVQTVSYSLFREPTKKDGFIQESTYGYKTPQLALDVQKGDRFYIRLDKKVRDNRNNPTLIHEKNYWYTGISLLDDTNMKTRQIKDGEGPSDGYGTGFFLSNRGLFLLNPDSILSFIL